MLDIRSPGEYLAGHIPGAISFPLFSDNERASIGTLYKSDGQKAAIKLGLELVGPKMISFIEKAEQLHSDTFRIYCWRGGMRSSSMGWLLEQYGFNIFVLEKGYKAFRYHAFQSFDKPLKLNVLTGLTGSGKTEILKAMKAMGAQVIDLEGLANHPGSSFGNQLQHLQPTTEMFQNMIFHELSKLDTDRPIWLEDESFTIGKVHMPEPLFHQMKDHAQRIVIKIPRHERQRFLVDVYGKMGKDQLKNGTLEIQKKLGTESTQKALELIDNGDHYAAAGILLTYYDRIYEKGISKAGKSIVGTLEMSSLCVEDIANKLIKTYEH